MSLPEKIFVVGAKGSGKTEFAMLLAEALDRQINDRGLACADFELGISECSSVLIGRLAEIMSAESHGSISLADAVKVILKKKDEYREALRVMGARMAKDSPGLLLTEAAASGRIVVGARRQAEVYGFYQQFKNRGGYGLAPWQGNHVWILVDRPGLPGTDFDDPFFRLQVCRHMVFNANGIEGLKGQAERLAEELCK